MSTVGSSKIQLRIDRDPAKVGEFQLHVRDSVLQLTQYVSRLCDLCAHFGGLHLQGDAGLNRVACFSDSQLGGANLSIHGIPAALRRQNAVVHLLYLKRDLVFGAAHIGSGAGRIRAAHVHSRAGFEILCNRL